MDTGTEVIHAEREVEVLAKAGRRRFTAEYKRRVLQEAAACTKPGELGALLRREGLYSSHLSAWRAARQRGELAGLTPRARGAKPRRPDPRDRIRGTGRSSSWSARTGGCRRVSRVPRGLSRSKKKSRGCWRSRSRATRRTDVDRHRTRAAAGRGADVRGTRGGPRHLLPAPAAAAGAGAPADPSAGPLSPRERQAVLDVLH